MAFNDKITECAALEGWSHIDISNWEQQRCNAYALDYPIVAVNAMVENTDKNAEILIHQLGWMKLTSCARLGDQPGVKTSR